MPRKTRSLVLEDVRRLSFREFDVPEIWEEDGLLKVEMCGVCRHEVGIYTGKAARTRSRRCVKSQAAAWPIWSWT